MGNRNITRRVYCGTMKRAHFMVMLMALAQPAAMTHMMNLGVPPNAVVPAPCPAQDTACKG